MSNLSYTELRKLLDTGVVRNCRPEQVNAASIDITLGPTILVERVPTTYNTVSLRSRHPLDMKEVDIRKGYIVKPGEFFLAHSVEIFNLPSDLLAEYHLKSSMARIGLNHLKAGWCDPGWMGSVLTLELMNVTRYHSIEVWAGDAIGQMEFRRVQPVPAEASYAARGRYNNDLTVKGVKP